MILFNCPFCGGKPFFSGDDCIACHCGASINSYGKNEVGDQEFVAGLWNVRSLDLEPQILKTAKITDLQSAYTDLCSAQWKIKHRS